MHPGQMVLRRAVLAVMAGSLVLALSGVAWSMSTRMSVETGVEVGALVLLPSGPVATGRINVNTATATDLEALPGIGPKKAAAIVAYRGAHGLFKRVDDLVEVKGIGPKTLAKLRPLVTCGGKKRPAQAPRRGR